MLIQIEGYGLWDIMWKKLLTWMRLPKKESGKNKMYRDKIRSQFPEPPPVCCFKIPSVYLVLRSSSLWVIQSCPCWTFGWSLLLWLFGSSFLRKRAVAPGSPWTTWLAACRSAWSGRWRRWLVSEVESCIRDKQHVRKTWAAQMKCQRCYIHLDFRPSFPEK